MTRIEGEQSVFPDDSVPDLRIALTELAVQSRDLTFRLLRAMALSMNQPREFFVKYHTKIFSSQCVTNLRSIYYPAINGSVEPGVVRCGEHSGTISYIVLNCF